MSCCGGRTASKEQIKKIEENRKRFSDILGIPICGYCKGILQRLPNGTMVCSRCLKRKS